MPKKADGLQATRVHLKVELSCGGLQRRVLLVHTAAWLLKLVVASGAAELVLIGH